MQSKRSTVSLIFCAFILSACGSSDDASSLQAVAAAPIDGNCASDRSTFTDEYDCNQSTTVVYAQVLDTLWNGGPSPDLLVDIKNVDVTRESMAQYIGSSVRLRFQIFVRTWVDFGEKTLAITAIDKNHPETLRANRARRVGYDPNGQFIYMLSFPANFGQVSDIYLETNWQGRKHFSNAGRPQTFFRLHTRGM